MNTPIVSILIPSRSRFDKLLRLITSAYTHCNDPNNIEVVVRFDDEDTESMARKNELKGFGNNCRYIIGKRFDGYPSLGVFSKELDDVAKAPWRWHLNNDMVITRHNEGRHLAYDRQLMSIPTEGVFVQPEWHYLGPSGYRNDQASSAPIYSGKMVEGIPVWGTPAVDTFLFTLAKQKNWEIVFLPGVGFLHDWHGHEDYTS